MRNPPKQKQALFSQESFSSTSTSGFALVHKNSGSMRFASEVEQTCPAQGGLSSTTTEALTKQTSNHKTSKFPEQHSTAQHSTAQKTHFAFFRTDPSLRPSDHLNVHFLFLQTTALRFLIAIHEDCHCRWSGRWRQCRGPSSASQRTSRNCLVATRPRRIVRQLRYVCSLAF